MNVLTTCLLFVSIFYIQTVIGQTHDNKFCNEWINYGLTYYKAKVHEDGMYRVDAFRPSASWC